MRWFASCQGHDAPLNQFGRVSVYDGNAMRLHRLSRSLPQVRPPNPRYGSSSMGRSFQLRKHAAGSKKGEVHGSNHEEDRHRVGRCGPGRAHPGRHDNGRRAPATGNTSPLPARRSLGRAPARSSPPAGSPSRAPTRWLAATTPKANGLSFPIMPLADIQRRDRQSLYRQLWWHRRHHDERQVDPQVHQSQ